MPFLCPECGVDLEQRDARAHALYHWPYAIEGQDAERYPEARKRRRAVLAYAAKQQKNPDVELE